MIMLLLRFYTVWANSGLPRSPILDRIYRVHTDSIFYLESPGDRPAYYKIADHLWGASANVDSDGNSSHPEDTQWTELSLFLRDGKERDQVHIDPVSLVPLILEIRSTDREVARHVVTYLHEVAGGMISQDPQKSG